MLRRYGRVAATAAAIVVLWTLWYTLEPRRTAYSCRTFWSCIGFNGRHKFVHSYPQLSEAFESQVTLPDGTIRFQRQSEGADPDVLVLVLNRDVHSWSSDFRSTQRTAHDFIDLLASTELNLTRMALGVLTSSAEEFESIKAATARFPVARTSIYLRKDGDESVSYQDRHNPRVQLARRSAIAKLRNYLMLSALQDEDHIIWIDADVVELSKDVVQTMIDHSETKDEAGIITATCHQNRMTNYDKNAWKVNSPQLLGPVADTDRETAIQQLVTERQMIPDLIRDTDDSALVPLDSVGGTILYIRSSLVRQGLTFPHFNVIGTTWAQRGWIGVETEGLCYMARELKGGGCYVLGGSHHARHTDWG